MHHRCRFLRIEVRRVWGRGGSIDNIVIELGELWNTIDVDLDGRGSERQWVGGPDDDI